MTLIISVFEQGFIYAIMALGIYITYKILDFPDLTVDCSFPMGAAITAVMINGGVPELKKQLDLNDAVPEISGTILFREDYLNKPQTQQAVSYLQSRWGS